MTVQAWAETQQARACIMFRWPNVKLKQYMLLELMTYFRNHLL